MSFERVGGWWWDQVTVGSICLDLLGWLWFGFWARKIEIAKSDQMLVGVCVCVVVFLPKMDNIWRGSVSINLAHIG